MNTTLSSFSEEQPSANLDVATVVVFHVLE